MFKRKVLKVKPEIDRNVILCDGKNLAYYANYGGAGELKLHQIKTGLYFSFFNTIRSLAKRFGTGDIVFLFDGHGSRRATIYKDYKYSRYDRTKKLSDSDLALKQAFKREYENLIKLVERLGFASYILHGYEADDLFGLFTKQFDQCAQIAMVTSDEDMYQLIRNNVFQFDLRKKIKKDLRWFKKQYNDIDPEQWAWIKAAWGCKTDDVAGIPRIGLKTAIKYLTDPESCSPKQIELIEGKEGQKIIKRNLELVTLPMPEIEDFILPYKKTNLDMDKWYKFCEEMRFNQFLNKYEEDFYMFTRDM